MPATFPIHSPAMPRFLPMSRSEMKQLGWDELDILLVTGDAYVDHPSFGAAILGRWLVAHGYRVGIVAQPAWQSPAAIAAMGRPRLFAGVTAGAMDSMLAHYTAFRKKRHDDAYTPGGVAGARPNRACLVYSGLVKQAFPKLPIVLGGIEASLRRLSHYDFWIDRLRRSILLDAKADLVLYGMAERSILAVAERAAAGLPLADASVPGAAYVGDAASLAGAGEVRHLPSHEDIVADPGKLIAATLAMEQHVLQARDFIVQGVEGRSVILTPPQPASQEDLDRLYALPFTRDPHPSYGGQKVPAAEMIRFSINSHRGCGGGCSFCTLSAHQGRTIQSRSEASVLAEVEVLSRHPAFVGSVSDIGGPTANMWQAHCTADPSACQRASCLSPGICAHFQVDQMQQIAMLRKARKMPGVKHVRVASGIRHDLALQDEGYIRALVREFIGGQLKIAPEHLADEVLKLMRKPGVGVFERFLDAFARECEAAGKPQYVVPYLISAFPGCTPKHMADLSRWLAARGWRPEQVQCFIPLPGTVAAAMYFAGLSPTGAPIPVARTDADRLRQHHMLVSPDPNRGAPGPARRNSSPAVSRRGEARR